MKILFAGPSLSGTEFVPMRPAKIVSCPNMALTCRGPAKCGDITHAVDQGFRVIGLVDGRFEDVAAVWHKEILHAFRRARTFMAPPAWVPCALPSAIPSA